MLSTAGDPWQVNEGQFYHTKMHFWGWGWWGWWGWGWGWGDILLFSWGQFHSNVPNMLYHSVYVQMFENYILENTVSPRGQWFNPLRAELSWRISQYTFHINGLVQDFCISNALGIKILQFCTKPSIPLLPHCNGTGCWNLCTCVIMTYLSILHIQYHGYWWSAVKEPGHQQP